MTAELFLACFLAAAAPGEDDEAALAAARTAALKTFKDQVAPFIATYCTRCHGEQKKKGGYRANATRLIFHHRPSRIFF